MQAGRALLFSSTFLLLAGCSLKNLGVRATAEILDEGIASFEAEPDVVLAREAAASQIKLLESLHRSDPRNGRVLLALARALGSYAFAFLESEAEKDAWARKRAADLYRRGAKYGLLLLDRRLGEGTGRLAESGSLEAWRGRLEKARPADVPALFWTGYDWAGGIRKSADSPSAVAALPKAVALVERALELDPGYHFGAPCLFMAVYYAERPRMLGGNPERALSKFLEADRIAAGRFVMTKFLMARTYAVRTQDSALFTRLLEEVISAPDDLLPEQRLAQEVAKIWAKAALKRKPDYFAEES